MKGKIGFYVTVCVAAASFCLVEAQSSAVAEGTATQEVVRSFGGEKTGGFSGGSSMGSFYASGFRYASGNAESRGKGTGSFKTGQNFASSQSAGFAGSFSEANGKFGKVKVSGRGEQANWASVGGSENFAEGHNATYGLYEGKVQGLKHHFHHRKHGEGTVSAGGFGAGKGKSSASFFENSNTRLASASTVGGSLSFAGSSRGGRISTVAAGRGGVSLWSSMTKGNTGAVADALGEASYKGMGNHFSNGFLKADGNTKVSVMPKRSEAVSSVSAVSKTGK